MTVKKMAPHPRLFITQQARKDLNRPTTDPFLLGCRTTVLHSANRFVSCPPLDYGRDSHNEHLIRARFLQGRVVDLLTAWQMTGKAKYRNAAVEHVRMMGNWEYWSWITWREGNSAPDAIFDLSYGENSATLAIAYDWLYDTLSPEEQSCFLDIARARPFAAGMKHGKPGAAWWFGHSSSNWNTVCAGGLGMLCLAMYEEIPEAKTLLPLMDQSIKPFFDYLKQSDGAWPEGIGYWNYGMYYGFMYLLSFENATGQKHPAFRIPQFRKTLAFPIEFCPNGVPCSFGDANGWRPMPLHQAVARRIGADNIVTALAQLAAQHPPAPKARVNGWPFLAEWCLLYEEPTAERPERTAVTKVYKGQDWGVFSDDLLSPTRAMTVRGGTTNAPHTHLDLLSFHCVVGDQAMITNIAPAEYLDSTFSARRWDIFEMRPDSKNTLFVNGVGITPNSSCDKTAFVTCKDATGIRMEATSAFGDSRSGEAAHFVGRTILFVRETYWVIIDKFETPHVARLESRMHTHAAIKLGKDRCALKRGKQQMRVTYASTQPAILGTAAGPLTRASLPAANMLRWATDRLYKKIAYATVLNPGTESRRVTLTQAGKNLVVDVVGKDGTDQFTLTPKLKLKI